MNFNNSGNNQRDTQTNVNTRGPQFMNREGFVPSTLIVGFWNEMVSLKIHPALPKEKQTDNKVFDYEQVIMTSITLEKISVLIDRIEKDIVPHLENPSKSIFRGVPIGGDSLIGVGVRVEEGDTNTVAKAYLAIFKNLDPSTKKPESGIFYEFKRSYTVDDYDPKTGEFSTTHDIQGELLTFLEILKAARTAMSNATSHSMRTVDKYYKDRILNTLNEVASKLGVSTGGGNYGSYRNNKQDVFSSGGGNKGASKDDLPDFDAPIAPLENINDIDSFM